MCESKPFAAFGTLLAPLVAALLLWSAAAQLPSPEMVRRCQSFPFYHQLVNVTVETIQAELDKWGPESLLNGTLPLLVLRGPPSHPFLVKLTKTIETPTVMPVMSTITGNPNAAIPPRPFSCYSHPRMWATPSRRLTVDCNGLPTAFKLRTMEARLDGMDIVNCTGSAVVVEWQEIDASKANFGYFEEVLNRTVDMDFTSQMYAWSNNMTNMTFTNNSAVEGAGVNIKAGLVQLENSIFVNNTAERGAAVYLKGPLTRLLRVANCTFHDNGRRPQPTASLAADQASSSQGNSSSSLAVLHPEAAKQGTCLNYPPAGSAIMATAGACVVVVEDSEFEGNNGTHGGAIHLHSTSCSYVSCYVPCNAKDWFSLKYVMDDGTSQPREWNGTCPPVTTNKTSADIQTFFTNTAFRRNTADLDGGALFWDQADSFIMDRVVFADNQAARDGGAVWQRGNGTMPPVESRVASSSFSRNSAGGHGGAVWFQGIADEYATLAATLTTFNGNAAGRQGSAQASAISSPCQQNVEDSNGGALHLSMQAQLLAEQVRFLGNSAQHQGGAIHCQSCLNVNVNYTLFANNTAAAGGAVDTALVRGYVLAVDSSFTNNSAMAIPGLRTSVSSNWGCPNGGGGAICLQPLSSRASLDNATFIDNTATNGGAVYLRQDTCMQLSTNDRCSVNISQYTTFFNNSAFGGGGGALYFSTVGPQWQKADPGVHIECAPKVVRKTTGVPDLVAHMVMNPQLMPCDEGWKGNRAYGGFGGDVASSPAYLIPEYSKEAVPSDRDLQVNITAFDFYGQRVLGGIEELLLLVASPDTFVVSENNVTLDQGRGQFHHVRVYDDEPKPRGEEVTRTVGITLTWKKEPVANTSIKLQVRGCKVGEISFGRGCRLCVNQQFSFEPTNVSCNVCPEASLCNASMLLPGDGFWASSPRSPQVHRCRFKDACRYDRREENLTSWHEDYGNMYSLNDTVYDDFMTKLCRLGYTGNLCGKCASGYGLVALQCTKCLGAGAHAVFYIMARGFEVLVVVLLVWLRLRRVQNQMLQIKAHRKAAAQLASYQGENGKGWGEEQARALDMGHPPAEGWHAHGNQSRNYYSTTVLDQQHTTTGALVVKRVQQVTPPPPNFNPADASMAAQMMGLPTQTSDPLSVGSGPGSKRGLPGLGSPTLYSEGRAAAMMLGLGTGADGEVEGDGGERQPLRAVPGWGEAVPAASAGKVMVNGGQPPMDLGESGPSTDEDVASGVGAPGGAGSAGAATPAGAAAPAAPAAGKPAIVLHAKLSNVPSTCPGRSPTSAGTPSGPPSNPRSRPPPAPRSGPFPPDAMFLPDPLASIPRPILSLPPVGDVRSPASPFAQVSNCPIPQNSSLPPELLAEVMGLAVGVAAGAAPSWASAANPAGPRLSGEVGSADYAASALEGCSTATDSLPTPYASRRLGEGMSLGSNLSGMNGTEPLSHGDYSELTSPQLSARTMDVDAEGVPGSMRSVRSLPPKDGVSMDGPSTYPGRRPASAAPATTQLRAVVSVQPPELDAPTRPTHTAGPAANGLDDKLRSATPSPTLPTPPFMPISGAAGNRDAASVKDVDPAPDSKEGPNTWGSVKSVFRRRLPQPAQAGHEAERDEDDEDEHLTYVHQADTRQLVVYDKDTDGILDAPAKHTLLTSASFSAASAHSAPHKLPLIDTDTGSDRESAASATTSSGFYHTDSLPSGSEDDGWDEEGEGGKGGKAWRKPLRKLMGKGKGKKARGAMAAQQEGWIEEITAPKQTAGAPASSTLEVLLAHMQMIGITQSIDLYFPHMGSGKTLAVMDLTSLARNLANLDCLVGAEGEAVAIWRVVFNSLFPLLLALLSLAFWAGRFWYDRVHLKKEHNFLKWTRQRMAITVVQIVFFYYSNVTSTLLSIFTCRQLDTPSGVYSANLRAVGRFWVEDMNKLCWAGNHQGLAWGFGLPYLLIFCLFPPLLVFAFLFSKRHSKDRHGRELLWNAKFVAKYGYLYEDFKQSAVYWRSITQLKLFVMNLMVAALATFGGNIQLFAFLGVVIVFLLLHTFLQPLRDPMSHWLDQTSMLVLAGTAYLYLTLVVSPSQLLSSVTLYLIVIANVLFVLACLWALWRGIWDLDTREQVAHTTKAAKRQALEGLRKGGGSVQSAKSLREYSRSSLHSITPPASRRASSAAMEHPADKTLAADMHVNVNGHADAKEHKL